MQYFHRVSESVTNASDELRHSQFMERLGPNCPTGCALLRYVLLLVRVFMFMRLIAVKVLLSDPDGTNGGLDNRKSRIPGCSLSLT